MSDSNRSSESLTQRAPLTPHSQQPQRESNPRLRSDSPVYWPLYDGAIYLLYPWSIWSEFPVRFSEQMKSRLSYRTSGSLSINHCDLSGHPMAHVEPSGPRHPLDPVLLRHTQINHSAFLAVGIIVPWRSNWRFAFFILSVCICSIAFPFRSCCPFCTTLNIAPVVWVVILPVV